MHAVYGLLMGACLFLGGLSAPGDPGDPADLTLTNPEVRYQFARTLDMTAELTFTTHVGSVPQKIIVFLQPQGALQPIQDEAFTQAAQKPGEWTLSYQRDLTAHPLPAFSEITYWYGIPDSNGLILTTEKASFIYEDNRKAWQGLAAPPFRIFWYEGTQRTGEETLAVAQASLKRAQEILALDASREMRIYVYPNAGELAGVQKMGALSGSGGGHLDPAPGLILVSAPPGAELSQNMPREVPHELMHILVYHRMGQEYRNLPAWLVEGLAEMAEPYPDPNESELLQTAHARGTLIPLEALCRTTPQETSGSGLAAAQVSSFMEFLFHQYGPGGVLRLMDVYRQGEECERGVSLVFGSSLTQLQQAWQEDAFRPVAPPSNRGSVIPWLFLMILLILVPIGFFAAITGRNRKMDA